jgi:glycosyltransferase involved in cell wall biosynthesis
MLATHTVVIYTLNSWESALPILRVTGPAEAAGMKVIYGNKWDQVDVQQVSSADIVVLQRDFPRLLDSYKKIVALARDEQKPIIYDLDDFLLELPEGHPDRENQYYADALLPMYKAIHDADLVTTSTQTLKEYLLSFNQNIHVLPNYLDDKLWIFRTSSETTNDKSTPVIIGFMGGDSHRYDLEAFQSVWIELLERYGEDITLRFWGCQPPASIVTRSNVEWNQFELLSYPEYANYVSRQTCDIFVAPLADNRFNRGKSPVKFLEYSTLKIPGVYSKLPGYEMVVRHGTNGFLASTDEDWLKYLTELIENPRLRIQIGAEAQNTVSQNWLLSQHALSWKDAYAKAIDEVRIPNRAIRHNQLSAFRLDEQIQTIIVDQQFRINKLRQENQNYVEKLKELKDRQAEYQVTARTLQEIYHSKAWKIVRGLWSIRLALAPPGSAQERLLKTLFGSKKEAPILRSEEISSLSSRPGVSLIRQVTGDQATISAQPIKDIDLLIFPVMEWESRTQRPQQLAIQFAESGYRIFYFHPYFRGDDRTVVRQVHHNIYEVQLSATAPVNIYTDSMSADLENSCLMSINSLQGEFKINRCISIINLPYWTTLAFHLRSEHGWKVIYDCMDYHPGFASNSQEMLRHEEHLSRQCDLLLVTSRFLLNEKSELNPNHLFVPNAADFDHFHQQPANRPQELEGIGNPIIGYYGAIADWFDVALIRTLAVLRPMWQFALIGSTKYASIDSVIDVPNVHLFGEKSYTELPSYLNAFDVAIIPFKAMELTQATNPVKLYEYLSAGKPVVATDLYELRYYEHIISLASTADQWLVEIERALIDNSPTRIRERIDFARQNTWEIRSEQIEKEFSRLLQPS